MGEVSNLRQARKAKERAAAAEEAGTKRAKFGVSKAEKTKVTQSKKQLDKHLDDHKRDAD
jgi:hypothetical protein